jgi:hypothetical protein
LANFPNLFLLFCSFFANIFFLNLYFVLQWFCSVESLNVWMTQNSYRICYLPKFGFKFGRFIFKYWI